MEFRRLMAFGNSSFIISVPKPWVEKNRLKKGDVLLVEEKPNELILSSKDESERKIINEVTVNPEGKSFEELKTEIIALYVNNYDLITVIGVKDANAIKEIFRGLVGMEIVEETATKIVAKDLLDIQEVSLENIIRRVDIITRSMLEDIMSLDAKNAESVSGRDKEVNRLCLLGFRTAKAATDNPRLLKLFNTNYWNIMLSKQVITYLERFADQLKRIIRIPSESKIDKKTMAEIIGLIDQLNTNYRRVMKIYYDKNRDAAIKFETTVRGLRREYHAMLEKNPTVKVAEIVGYFEHTVGAMKGILRTVMEFQ